MYSHCGARAGLLEGPVLLLLYPLVPASECGHLELGRVRWFASRPPETCCRAFGVFRKPWENLGQVPTFDRFQLRRPTLSSVLRVQQSWEDVPQLERTPRGVRRVRAAARSVRPQGVVDEAEQVGDTLSVSRYHLEVVEGHATSGICHPQTIFVPEIEPLAVFLAVLFGPPFEDKAAS